MLAASQPRSLAASQPRSLAGTVAGLGIRSDAAVATTEVEDDGRRHDEHVRDAFVLADSALFEAAHDTCARIQVKSAAAGQQHRSHLLDEISRLQNVGLARARYRAAYVDTAHRAVFGHDDRAARGPAAVGEVADADAWHVGNASGIVLPGSAGWREREAQRQDGKDGSAGGELSSILGASSGDSGAGSAAPALYETAKAYQQIQIRLFRCEHDLK